MITTGDMLMELGALLNIRDAELRKAYVAERQGHSAASRDYVKRANKDQRRCDELKRLLRDRGALVGSK